MSKKRITVLVSNDLEFDQRVAKVCSTLEQLNFDITLVGRRLSTSRSFQRSYPVIRFNLLFTKGFLFYTALNVRFFFYLLYAKTDIILANDLDTLLPAFIVSKLRGKQLVYDSHEYFTEAEGLTGRAFQKGVWLRIERFIFPKLKRVYTVNESIAAIYRDLYKVKVEVVRNIPRFTSAPPSERSVLGLPLDKKVIILQGAYLDPDRGAKEALEAMAFLDDALLVIIGSGREMPLLKRMASQPEFADKVRILDKMPADKLRLFTQAADLGLSLDKPLHLNYTLSLPNKLFDYIHAGIPVVVSDLPELRRIIKSYQVGWIVPAVEPRQIAQTIQEALTSEQWNDKKQNCHKAAQVLNWENEEKVLKRIFSF
jgi:glycosyltransferase involved in cell wall biosynthesis